ncbi:probable serine/threonine-protein kinase HSL1, partial [Limulus polyphemus]|uniref:Probable serine/threonine-protein kinase HSL1 n=1 Tax=Limulus polyphemus TaxID=6850 RepID=A0ABM1T6U6_LIMPO
VAIKTIKKSKIDNEQDLIRIRREIQVMSSIQHPHIIHIYEVFENTEKIVLVMQYASGGELYDLLSEKKVFSDTAARRLFRQIAAAVYYCHKNQICHRDLKLENILLDEKGNAKIGDFGLSNIFSKQYLLNTFCGSPLYASPEIVKGTPYHGPEVDCWSLGVLLYTLVYGAMPFDGGNFKHLVRQICEGDYHEPKKRSEATGLIRHLLTVSPAKRATIVDICTDSWVNLGYDHSLLQIAEDLSNLMPVRLDILLALVPSSSSINSLKKEDFPVIHVQSATERLCDYSPSSDTSVSEDGNPEELFEGEDGETTTDSFAFVTTEAAENISKNAEENLKLSQILNNTDEASVIETVGSKRRSEESYNNSLHNISIVVFDTNEPQKLLKTINMENNPSFTCTSQELVSTKVTTENRVSETEKLNQGILDKEFKIEKGESVRKESCQNIPNLYETFEEEITTKQIDEALVSTSLNNDCRVNTNSNKDNLSKIPMMALQQQDIYKCIMESKVKLDLSNKENRSEKHAKSLEHTNIQGKKLLSENTSELERSNNFSDQENDVSTVTVDKTRLNNNLVSEEVSNVDFSSSDDSSSTSTGKQQHDSEGGTSSKNNFPTIMIKEDSLQCPRVSRRLSNLSTTSTQSTNNHVTTSTSPTKSSSLSIKPRNSPTFCKMAHEYILRKKSPKHKGSHIKPTSTKPFAKQDSFPSKGKLELDKSSLKGTFKKEKSSIKSKLKTSMEHRIVLQNNKTSLSSKTFEHIVQNECRLSDHSSTAIQEKVQDQIIAQCDVSLEKNTKNESTYCDQDTKHANRHCNNNVAHTNTPYKQKLSNENNSSDIDSHTKQLFIKFNNNIDYSLQKPIKQEETKNKNLSKIPAVQNVEGFTQRPSIKNQTVVIKKQTVLPSVRGPSKIVIPTHFESSKSSYSPKGTEVKTPSPLRNISDVKKVFEKKVTSPVKRMNSTHNLKKTNNSKTAPSNSITKKPTPSPITASIAGVIKDSSSYRSPSRVKSSISSNLSQSSPVKTKKGPSPSSERTVRGPRSNESSHSCKDLKTTSPSPKTASRRDTRSKIFCQVLFNTMNDESKKKYQLSTANKGSSNEVQVINEDKQTIKNPKKYTDNDFQNQSKEELKNTENTVQNLIHSNEVLENKKDKLCDEFKVNEELDNGEMIFKKSSNSYGQLKNIQSFPGGSNKSNENLERKVQIFDGLYEVGDFIVKYCDKSSNKSTNKAREKNIAELEFQKNILEDKITHINKEGIIEKMAQNEVDSDDSTVSQKSMDNHVIQIINPNYLIIPDIVEKTENNPEAEISKLIQDEDTSNRDEYNTFVKTKTCPKNTQIRENNILHHGEDIRSSMSSEGYPVENVQTDEQQASFKSLETAVKEQLICALCEGLSLRGLNQRKQNVVEETLKNKLLEKDVTGMKVISECKNEDDVIGISKQQVSPEYIISSRTYSTPEVYQEEPEMTSKSKTRVVLKPVSHSTPVTPRLLHKTYHTNSNCVTSKHSLTENVHTPFIETSKYLNNTKLVIPRNYISLSSSSASSINVRKETTHADYENLSPKGASEDLLKPVVLFTDNGNVNKEYERPSSITRSFRKFTFNNDDSCVTEAGKIFELPAAGRTWNKMEEDTKSKKQISNSNDNLENIGHVKLKDVSIDMRNLDSQNSFSSNDVFGEELGNCKSALAKTSGKSELIWKKKKDQYKHTSKDHNLEAKEWLYVKHLDGQSKDKESSDNENYMDIHFEDTSAVMFGSQGLWQFLQATNKDSANHLESFKHHSEICLPPLNQQHYTNVSAKCQQKNTEVTCVARSVSQEETLFKDRCNQAPIDINSITKPGPFNHGPGLWTLHREDQSAKENSHKDNSANRNNNSIVKNVTENNFQDCWRPSRETVNIPDEVKEGASRNQDDVIIKNASVYGSVIHKINQLDSRSSSSEYAHTPVDSNTTQSLQTNNFQPFYSLKMPEYRRRIVEEWLSRTALDQEDNNISRGEDKNIKCYSEDTNNTLVCDVQQKAEKSSNSQNKNEVPTTFQISTPNVSKESEPQEYRVSKNRFNKGQPVYDYSNYTPDFNSEPLIWESSNIASGSYQKNSLDPNKHLVPENQQHIHHTSPLSINVNKDTVSDEEEHHTKKHLLVRNQGRPVFLMNFPLRKQNLNAQILTPKCNRNQEPLGKIWQLQSGYHHAISQRVLSGSHTFTQK